MSCVYIPVTFPIKFNVMISQLIFMISFSSYFYDIYFFMIIILERKKMFYINYVTDIAEIETVI